MTRVVLVVPRRGVTDPGNRLAVALDRIASLGYELVAVVDPAESREALRMVLDDACDLVVVARPEDFTLVQVVADLGGSDSRRPRPVLRPAEQERARVRRPRPVESVQPVDDALVDRGQRTRIIRRTA